MTAFDIAVPLIALGIAVAGVVILKLTDPMRRTRRKEKGE